MTEYILCNDNVCEGDLIAKQLDIAMAALSSIVNKDLVEEEHSEEVHWGHVGKAESAMKQIESLNPSK